MSKFIRKLVLLSLMNVSFTAFADVDMEYKQSKLPDGSAQTEYNNSDGSKVVQIQRPDGTIETQASDAQGNETKTVQHPDGRVELKTKAKNNKPQ